MSAQEPTVVIADDHQLTRLGVRMALIRGGFRVVGEASDANSTVAAVLRERPDVCLLDVRMPGGGIEAARRLHLEAPDTSLVMLTVSTSTEDVLASLRAGALGYLPKDTTSDRLPAALCGVLKGEAALPRALMGRVLHEFRGLTADVVAEPSAGDGDGVQLTPRELEILRLLRTGRGTMQIADLLSLSPITVRRHISSGVAKLGVADRDEAIRAIDAARSSAWA